jgi:Domain of unknown function (DUF4145)
MGEIAGSISHDHEEVWEFGRQVLLARCSTCDETIVIARLYERIPADETYYEFGSPYRIWPNPVPKLSDDVPRAIRQDFEEAHKCLSVGAFNGATLLARRMLEAIARDKGATANNLHGKLRELQTIGLLDGRLVEWADALREAGNEAAHGASGIRAKEEATDVLALAEAVADYVYTFQLRYESFMTRRAKP